ncbi:type II secretion system minor pseudopilin GspI [Sphingomonas sp. 28-63-12]|uniref:type II secretion system minor pseudopilin GspI n=1 Tax=Sphingomonas sp. 28-63-12 TaxID=1970434 RepID=UPI000BCB0E44|nr:MAG: type II secretion system protein GspI [Sphingomonas sp. 28-63-12]
MGPAAFGRRSRSADDGFTLIEMMVALAVFSLAALALIRLEGATIRSAGILDSTLLASMVAHNVAVETVTEAQPPVTGESRGLEDNGGRSWSWRRVATPIGDQGVMRIDVSVSDATGTVLGHLTMVRPPNRPVVPLATDLPGVRPQ